MRNITALITKENKPKVMMVSGNPKKLKTGFTIRLRIPNTKARIIEVPKSSMLMPGKIFCNKKAEIAVISKLIIILISLILEIDIKNVAKRLKNGLQPSLF